MNSDIVIQATNLSKCYQIYDRPRDRVKQFFLNPLQRVLGIPQSHYFQEFWALRELSFDIRKGETIGIIGRNGSGKSTLLQLICGTLNPTTGSVSTHGRISALLELGSGFNPEYTGRENIFLNGTIHGLSREEIEKKFDQIASFADIGEFLDQPVKTYSSGMYARIAFSASMFTDPDVLIVDEILAVGDGAFQAKCLRAFHKLRDNGCAVIIVAHDSYMMKKFCSRVLYLQKGFCVGFGESASIVDKYNVEIQKAMKYSGEGGDVTSPSPEIDSSNSSFQAYLAITSVDLLDDIGEKASMIASGQTITLKFTFSVSNKSAAPSTFVVNLYRHDGLYIMGATTLMDSIEPMVLKQAGTVRITFPSIKLLSGSYFWRVAINDERAFGVYAEANHVCPFEVTDNLEAVGLINLDRSWAVELEN
jgi:ABC-type polysaccharide/polyol phosphate transport system ATPase subunit